MRRSSDRLPRWLLVPALLAGLMAAVAMLMLSLYLDNCPRGEDEGLSAAPHSAYALVLCSGNETTWILPSVVLVATVLLLWLLRHRRVPQLLAALLIPPLIVAGLHLTLPQGCLTGDTRSGPCSRDRELQ